MNEPHWMPTHVFSEHQYRAGTLIALLPTGSAGQIHFFPLNDIQNAALPPGWYFPIPPAPRLEIIESEFVPEEPVSAPEEAGQPCTDA